MEGTLAFSGRASINTSEPASRQLRVTSNLLTCMQSYDPGKQINRHACSPILDKYCKAPFMCFTWTPTMDAFRLMYECSKPTHGLAAHG